MKKINNKEESKLTSKKILSTNKSKSLSTSKQRTILQKSDNFPKNANEFKHIMDDITCGVSDIEYMLQLRRNKKIGKINKEIATNSPSFFDEDAQKYKKKYALKVDEKEFLKTNLGTFKYILSDRTNYAVNETQYNLN